MAYINTNTENFARQNTKNTRNLTNGGGSWAALPDYYQNNPLSPHLNQGLVERLQGNLDNMGPRPTFDQLFGAGGAGGGLYEKYSKPDPNDPYIRQLQGNVAGAGNELGQKLLRQQANLANARGQDATGVGSQAAYLAKQGSDALAQRFGDNYKWAYGQAKSAYAPMAGYLQNFMQDYNNREQGYLQNLSNQYGQQQNRVDTRTQAEARESEMGYDRILQGMRAQQQQKQQMQQDQMARLNFDRSMYMDQIAKEATKHDIAGQKWINYSGGPTIAAKGPYQGLGPQISGYMG